jgi:hypothetical protein
LFPIVEDAHRIGGAALKVVIKGELQIIHHYLRFIGRGTELWIFGSGLGEYALAQQLGDSFLGIVDRGDDPQLGRIMWSLGYNPSATRPYKGDINIVWSYGVSAENLENRLKEFVGITPDIVLSPHKPIRDKAEELGIKGIHMHAGVSSRLFFPMGLERTTVGFVGLDNKSLQQRRIVLGPALDREILDWRTRKMSDPHMSLDDLNKYYNTLKVTFGMVPEERHHMDYMPSRLFETLATGTPLIIYKLHNFRRNFGFDYPYQTTSYEETEEHLDYILGNQETVLKQMEWYSDYVIENHSYEKKLEQLFKELKK